MLLLMKRIAKPRWWMSLLSCIFSLYQRSRWLLRCISDIITCANTGMKFCD
jgi:hypothetical protein